LNRFCPERRGGPNNFLKNFFKKKQKKKRNLEPLGVDPEGD
jgi:hypothetical protein